MKNKTKMSDTEIVLEIYRRMFKEAEPSGNIDKIIKSGEGKKADWFLKYYLPNDRQDKIIKEVCKENKVLAWKIPKFYTECILGSSPTSQRKIMLREIKNETTPKRRTKCNR